MELNKEILVERLSSKLELQGVFLYNYSIAEEIKEHLMVVITPVKGVSPSTLAPIVKLCMADMKEIPFHIVLEGDWLSQLRKGSLYHSYASLPKHRLYYGKTKEIDALLNKKTVNSLMELNRSDYEKARQYAKEYTGASVDFAVKGSYDQAVYMLHQSIEVRIRSFYTLLGRQLGKNHNLENIIRNVRGIVPELLSVFAYGAADVELYRLLDTAYKTCVKGDSTEISVEQYDFISTQCICLAEILDAMVDRMVAEVAEYRALLPVEKPEVEKWGKKERFHYSTFCKEDNLVFSNSPYRLLRSSVNEMEELKIKLSQKVEQVFLQANIYLLEAELLEKKQLPNIAALLLQKCLVYAYKNILFEYNYKLYKTHSLSKLQTRVRFFFPQACFQISASTICLLDEVNESITAPLFNVEEIWDAQSVFEEVERVLKVLKATFEKRLTLLS